MSTSSPLTDLTEDRFLSLVGFSSLGPNDCSGPREGCNPDVMDLETSQIRSKNEGGPLLG
ncbi:hypothetical protein [[Eubacterium] cellulosolvens]